MGGGTLAGLRYKLPRASSRSRHPRPTSAEHSLTAEADSQTGPQPRAAARPPERALSALSTESRCCSDGTACSLVLFPAHPPAAWETCASLGRTAMAKVFMLRGARSGVSGCALKGHPEERSPYGGSHLAAPILRPPAQLSVERPVPL